MKRTTPEGSGPPSEHGVDGASPGALLPRGGPRPPGSGGASSGRSVAQLETTVGALLRIGTAGSLLVIVGGALLTLVQHPEYLDDPAGLAAIRGPHHPARTISALIAGLREGRGESFMLLGLLLLVATPVARVLLSALFFIKVGDRAFAVLATIVLALLILSFFLGRSG